MTPAERVGAVLELVAPLVDDGQALRDALAEGPLSAQGLELAFRDHLETEADPAWLATPPPPRPRAHLSLAGNVCVAAARAVAVALFEAPSLRVRPSRRDPHLARHLVAGLRRRGLDVEEVAQLAPSPGDAVHLYGDDVTLDTIARELPDGVWLRRFGHGFGVAAAEVVGDAQAIVDALVPFDGAGCLSPRVVAAPTAEAEALAVAIHEAATASSVPRGPLQPEDRAALRRVEATYGAVGKVWSGPHHLVAFDPEPEALTLLPPLRCTLVVAVDEVAPLFGPHAAAITALGGLGPLADAIAHLAPDARRGPIARMQRPPLDGPVDRRRAAAPRPLAPRRDGG